MEVQLCRLPLTMSIHIQFITILQAMASLMGDVFGGFVDDSVVWYEFISEIVSNMNLFVSIDTGCVI